MKESLLEDDDGGYSSGVGRPGAQRHVAPVASPGPRGLTFSAAPAQWHAGATVLRPKPDLASIFSSLRVADLRAGADAEANHLPEQADRLRHKGGPLVLSPRSAFNRVGPPPQ